MMLRWFFLLFCAIGCQFAYSQSYSFLSYSIAEGLPQSQVSSIAEDEKGYLWVGTLGGLGRFNGSSFVNYSTREGLLNNRITSLNFFDEKLWIGHEGGVSLLNKGKIRKWIFPEKHRKKKVSVIQPFLSGCVIATNGGGLYFINKDLQIRDISLRSEDEDRVRGLAVYGKELYVATRAGLLKTTDLYNFESIKGSEGLNISGIAMSGSELILTTIDEEPGGFFRFNLKDQKIERFGKIPTQTAIGKCTFDSRGNVWASSHDGVVVVDKSGRMRAIDEKTGLPLNAISTIYEDRNGTIWIGSEGKGIFRFPGEQFKYFNSKNGIQSDLIVSVLEISPNRYLFGSYEKGLIEYSSNATFIRKELTENTLWALEKDAQGNVWIGSNAGLLKYLPSGKVETFDEVAGTPGLKITTFFKDSNGDIWVGGDDGLSKIVNGKIIRIKDNLLPPKKGLSPEEQPDIGTIRNIIKYKNQLLCATDRGLFLFSNGQYKLFLGITQKTACLETDEYGNLWIGTEEGFYWSDGKNLKQIYLSDQPASSFINFICLSKNKDQVFVGTNNGLYLLSNLQQKSAVKHKHYGLEQGLVNLELNLNSSFIDHKGRLWFGTSQGLTVFDPKLELFDFGKVMPYLNIKSLKLNFQDFNYSDYSSRFDEYGIPLNLVLPRSKNNLSIELDGVALKDSKDLKFQYWLEGLDEKWSPPFSNPQVTLSNLPSGSYNLHVRAINGVGGISNEYVLFIRITPAFYTTSWFFILVFLFIVGLVILIIQLRVRRERAKSYQETLEFKARLSSLEQQSLNASMNRHFIFNSLNSIQYFINTQDKVSANRYLTNFAKLIRKNLDSSSEDNNMVSLSQEIERLELYLSLESMRFRDRFDYKIEVSNIETESIMVPAMLFQPFVENSIIHGILPVEDRKGLISINIIAKDDYLEITLEDNGIGIDYSINKKRQSNGDHKSQGMEITSKRIALLKKLSNRDFEMEGPFQIEKEDGSINGTRVLLKIPYENLDDED